MSQKSHPFYFCDLFSRCYQILLIFDRNVHSVVVIVAVVVVVVVVVEPLQLALP